MSSSQNMQVVVCSCSLVSTADTAQLRDASHDLTSMQTNAISCTVNLVSLTQTCALSLLYHFQYVTKHAFMALTLQYFVPLSLYE